VLHCAYANEEIVLINGFTRHFGAYAMPARALRIQVTFCAPTLLCPCCFQPKHRGASSATIALYDHQSPMCVSTKPYLYGPARSEHLRQRRTKDKQGLAGVLVFSTSDRFVPTRIRNARLSKLVKVDTCYAATLSLFVGANAKT
jgi:hypothetical protein